MPIKGRAFWLPYVCLDGENRPLAGDLANHTISFWADGVDAAATNNQGGAGKHVEVGNGVYAILITAAEAACFAFALHGTSSTTDAVIVPRLSDTDGGTKSKADFLASGWLANPAPVSADGRLITVTRGSSYLLATGNELRWSDSDDTWGDLTGATVTLNAVAGIYTLTKTAVVDLAGEEQSVYVEWTSADSVQFVTTSNGWFDLHFAWPDGHVLTLPVGRPGKLIVAQSLGV
jgi:hypothetical protein